jgi:hypothetical protein
MLRRTLLALPGTVCVQGPEKWLVYSFEPSVHDRAGTLVLTVESEQAVAARRKAVPPVSVREFTIDGIIGIVRVLAGMCMFASRF